MLNKLTAFAREYDMIAPGDQIICAVSGGADSMALLWSMYLLKEKLGITLAAAHFNHHLRGAESDADEAFVREFCQHFEIPLYVGGTQVQPGKKGLEAAAREARYSFFATLPGKIATAHTADDNAETVLMHLVRGTGLKGLGGISPVGPSLIRPMLTVTRQEVLELLQEYSIRFRQDSSNDTDAFLRNRLRHHVMPLLREENPRLVENLTAMALDLRADEAALACMAENGQEKSVSQLALMPQALRRRYLQAFLQQNGVREPERSHIALAEALVFSEKPSARAFFPGNVILERRYDALCVAQQALPPEPVAVQCPGITDLPAWGLRLICTPTEQSCNTPECFAVSCDGPVWVRPRLSGDTMCLSGGTKSLKKLFIDRKIPASLRHMVPVLAEENAVLGVYGIGANLEKATPQWCFRFEPVIYGQVPSKTDKDLEDSVHAQ